MSSSQSVSMLRNEADAARTRLKSTTQEIKDRLQPASIKSEASDYVRASGNRLWNSLERTVRARPLEAVAVGAAAALPILSLIRTIPSPLLLIGTGLLLSRASETESVQRAIGSIKERATETLQTTQSHIEEAAESARRTVHNARDYATESLAQATEGAASLKDKIQDSTASVASKFQEQTDALGSKSDEVFQRTREKILDTWEKNPLMIAGIGLGIGAFIAAAFPTTKAEGAALGAARDAVRRTAEDAAIQGVEAVRSTVQRAVATASEEGLSPEGLSRAGQSVTQKVRALAEKGVTAALGEEKTQPANQGQPNSSFIPSRQS